MEEWGYAGSWFNQLNEVKTVPTNCGNEIPVEMTDCSNRCITYLIETTEQKTPPESALGNSESLWKFERTNRTNYVNVIMRQSLILIDFIRPYSIILKVEEDQNDIQITWRVGGSFIVNETKIMAFSVTPSLLSYASSSGYLSSDLTDIEYHSLLTIVSQNHPLFQTNSLSGISPVRKGPRDSFKLSTDSNQLTFQTRINSTSEDVILIAVSHVDQFMKDIPVSSNPAVPPQSHFAHLHFNETYSCYDKKTGRQIEGRHVVVSRPYLFAGRNLEVKEVKEEKEEEKMVEKKVKENTVMVVDNDTEVIVQYNFSSSINLSIPVIILLGLMDCTVLLLLLYVLCISIVSFNKQINSIKISHHHHFPKHHLKSIQSTHSINLTESLLSLRSTANSFGFSCTFTGILEMRFVSFTL